MNRTEKEALVAELSDKIKGATALYYTDFTGLNVKRMTELRRTLRKANVEYVVIKNTLALRAVNDSGLVGERLRGPSTRPSWPSWPIWSGVAMSTSKSSQPSLMRWMYSAPT